MTEGVSTHCWSNRKLSLRNQWIANTCTQYKVHLAPALGRQRQNSARSACSGHGSATALLSHRLHAVQRDGPVAQSFPVSTRLPVQAAGLSATSEMRQDSSMIYNTCKMQGVQATCTLSTCTTQTDSHGRVVAPTRNKHESTTCERKPWRHRQSKRRWADGTGLRAVENEAQGGQSQVGRGGTCPAAGFCCPQKNDCSPTTLSEA